MGTGPQTQKIGGTTQICGWGGGVGGRGGGALSFFFSLPR